MLATLSAGSGDGLTFPIIFHEYIHSNINTNFGKSELPTWFNEKQERDYATDFMLIFSRLHW